MNHYFSFHTLEEHYDMIEGLVIFLIVILSAYGLAGIYYAIKALLNR